MDNAFNIIFKKSLPKVTKFRIPAFHVDRTADSHLRWVTHPFSALVYLSVKCGD